MGFGCCSREKSGKSELLAGQRAGSYTPGAAGDSPGQRSSPEDSGKGGRLKKIVLAGNPNVGKSVLFTRLSGVYAFSSNYPGTTVDFLQSKIKKNGEWYELIDAPGAYSLKEEAEAEQIAARLVEEADVVINVVDATNLERNLYLTFELAEKQKPMIVALNMWDEARKQGIEIDVRALSAFLGVPVIPIVATTGEGIKELMDILPAASVPHPVSCDHERRWEEIGEIIERVQRFSYRRPGWREIFQKITVLPVSGTLIGLGVIGGMFFLVRAIGEGIISYLAEPLFNGLYLPLLEKLSALLSGHPFWHGVLIGKLIDGRIDFELSFGLLTSGFYIPLGVVFPYILAFYFMLSLLEDVGYLPRLAVILDGFLHRLGLHGYSVVPALLGWGCNVPGVMATRVLESEQERFIVATLISIAIPCSAQQALIVGVLASYGVAPILIVYGTLALVGLTVALLLKYLVPGARPALICEMPPYRLPFPRALFSKLWIRLRGFLIDALPIMLVGIAGLNLLFLTNVFPLLARVISPWLARAMGLPREAILIIIMGLLRKDMAMGMLLPLNLSVKQLIISSVVLSMFFPCIATFVVFLKELGWKRLLQGGLIMLASSFLVGSLLNFIL